MKLSEKLSALRTQHGLSQEELATRLGVSRQALGNWENGRAMPELTGIIALSRYFSVSIDSLINDAACSIDSPEPPAQNTLCRFLLCAKRATYAGHAMEISPQRTGAHEFAYQDSDYFYRDSYYGGKVFHGEEVVTHRDIAIWCMNYSGRTLSNAFSGDFLKLALRHGTPDMPYRGPAIFRNGGYTYVCECRGDLGWFRGKEHIYHNDQLIYECYFHGGMVK